MHMLDGKGLTQMSRLARGLCSALVIAALSSACVLDTETALCSRTELRCPPGWICSADQDSCIRIGRCGDGFANSGEVCDDGNRRSGDGCSSDCLSDETCGNGTTDVARDEACDDGNTLNGDGCTFECRAEMCGNHIVDVDFKEVCDDGNGVSSDGCSADCRSNEACGNGITDEHMGETCDFPDAPPFPHPTTNTFKCNSNCTLPVCGDGHHNPLHITTEGHLEQCDSGKLEQGAPTRLDSNICDFDCSAPVCGDGHANMPAGEQCDTGDTDLDTIDCNGKNCQNTKCPDGIHNAAAGEDCDTGEDTAACNSNCKIPRCGDHHVNSAYTPPGGTSTEQCDAGAADAPTCDYDCTFAICGDDYQNIMHTPPGATWTEECDDGTMDLDGDGRINSNTAQNACRTNCRKAYCGDDVRDTHSPGPADDEECDDGEPDIDNDGRVNSNTEADACRTNCKRARCGDGVKDTGEACDPGPGSTSTCTAPSTCISPPAANACECT